MKRKEKKSKEMKRKEKPTKANGTRKEMRRELQEGPVEVE